MKSPRFPHGRAIRTARTALDLTQRELAELAGVHTSVVCYCETGVRVPSIGSFLRVLAAAGCSVKIRSHTEGAWYDLDPGSFPIPGHETKK
jgi:predicted transcriptional regulator